MPVSTDVRPPFVVPDPRLGGPPRGRSLVIAAVLAAVATAAVLLWPETPPDRHPLENRFLSGFRGARSKIVGGDLGAARIVTYEHGAEFVYSFDITNRSDRPVEVVAIPIVLPRDDEYVFMIEQLGPLMGRRAGDLDATLVPFQPFALGPGESRLVGMRARFWDCWANRGRGVTNHITDQRFRLREDGGEVVQEVPLQLELVVTGPPRSDCPARSTS